MPPVQDHASKTKGFTWLAAAVVLGVACAQGLSPVARAVPWSWEQRLGRTLSPYMAQAKCRNDAQAQAALKRLIARPYPLRPGDGAFSIDVQVAKDHTVNAHAGLGGAIFLNSGLLKSAESADELAGVLAHEIEHVRRRHVMQAAIMHFFTSQGVSIIFGGQPSAEEWAGFFLNMDFSRAQETQADEGGLERLQAAHISNEGYKRFFERMGRGEGAHDGFLSDHPSNSERLAMVEQFENRDTTPALSPAEWAALKQGCGER